LVIVKSVRVLLALVLLAFALFVSERRNFAIFVYALYIDESSEDSELVIGLRTLENNIPFIALRYCNRSFIHNEYERLRRNVLEYVSGHRYDRKMLEELDKNIDRALLRGDFLLSETTCMENLHASLAMAERNYWTSVLYTIHARLGKL